MLTSNNKVSIRQLQALFILDIFGTGIIILPRIVTEFTENDGWIIIIGATLFALIYAFIINTLSRRFPKDCFVDYSKKIVSKPIGSIISLVLAVRLIFTAGLELRVFAEIIKQTMLYQTPMQITSIVMALSACYLASKGYENRARLGEILFLIVLIPLFIVFITGAFGCDFSNLQPFFKTNPTNIIQGSYYVSFAFRGLELVALVYPYANNPEKIRKSQSMSIIFIGAIMLFITLITIAKFNVSDTKAQLWPVIQMIDTISIPGSFFERQDSLIIMFWIISVFISVSAGVFFSSYIFKKVYEAKKQNSYLYLTTLLIIIVSMLPGNIVDTYTWINFIDQYIGILYFLFIPLILLIIAKIRGLKDEK